MPNKYKLLMDSSKKFKVFKNGKIILPSTSRKKAEEYIKFNKKLDKEHRILNNNFEINSIWRADLVEYVGKEQVLKLTNKEMKNIARLMGEYMQEDYWFCLTEALDKLNIKTIEN